MKSIGVLGFGVFAVVLSACNASNGNDTAQTAAVNGGKADAPDVHQLKCENKDGERLTLTLEYQLQTVETFDDDRLANITGQFRSDTATDTQSGTVSGQMTPMIWYGGSFDAQLSTDAGSYGRLLIFRTLGGAHIWLRSENGEGRDFTCDGEIR